MSSLRSLGVPIGFAGGTACTTIEQVRADVAWASDAGFDSYWLSHVFGVDPFVAIAAAAASGPNLAELGTSVVATAGRHPIAMAQLARTTQQACEGRFTLGFGPSHEVVVEAIFGERWAGPVARIREYLDVLAPLCAGESAGSNGEQVSGHVALNIPCDPVPLVLAALGPKMLEVAGARTAGTHLGNCGPRTIAEHIAPGIAAAAAEAGRPAPRIIALVAVAVTDDIAAARAFAAQMGAGYGALPSYRAMLDREGVAGPEDLLVAGSIDQVIDGLGAYVDAGATDLRIAAGGSTPAEVAATRAALADALS